VTAFLTPGSTSTRNLCEADGTLNPAATGSRRIGAFALAAALCLTLNASRGDSSPDKPETAPEPPAQSKPWTPPATSLDPVIIRAVDELFADGMADPRGCEYREIEIAENGRWKIKAHGWVLPGGGPQRYAIGWNGVIYPVASIGAPVDLHKEIAALPTGPVRRFLGNGNGWPMSDQGSLSADLLLPVQVAVLLRLDEGQLATDAWNEGYDGEPDMKTKDPFADMASVWLGRWFNQAIMAYLRGDYSACAAICHRVAEVQTKVEAGAARRGQTSLLADDRHNERLWQLPILQAEAERRLHEQPFTTVLESGQPAGGPERVAALIRDLETVSVEQMMNPGETDVMTDPTVQELIKQGQAAVEPLITCLAEDNRLTKSVFTAGMGYEGAIIPVYHAARAVLNHVLGTSIPLFEPVLFDSISQNAPRDLSSADRHALAAKFEAAWQKVKGVNEIAAAYAALRDDTAGADAWFKAVDTIVQPADGTFTSYRIMPADEAYTIHQGNAPFLARGDVLRAKVNPSVTDLMIKRFEQLVHDDADRSMDSTRLDNLLLAFAGWDGVHHLEDVHRLGEEMEARSLRMTGRTDRLVNVTLAQQRIDLGDKDALPEYLDWLAAQPMHTMQADDFSILWQYPGDPRARQTADKIFNNPAMPWRPEISQDQDSLVHLLHTPMLGLAAFRKAVARALGDKRVIAQIKDWNNGNFSLVTGTENGQGEPYQSPEGPSKRPLASSEVRRCDYVADRISKVDGFPCCALEWSAERRDAAVAACRDVLLRYGDDFAYRASDPDFRQTDTGVVWIHFPLLTHPATAEDVAQGRAIFALPGTTRLCTAPKLPVIAWRPSRQMDPQQASQSTADGQSKEVTIYNTRGQIWQAEEELVDGKWQRYYGFAGRYQLEKVPAAEIEFEEFSTDVAPGLSAQIESPFEFDRSKFNLGFGFRKFIAPGTPIPVKVSIANHTGLDQAVPAALLLPAVPGKALPPGLTLALDYSDKLPPHIFRWSEQPFVYGPWTSVPLRPDVGVSPNGGASTALTPTQQRTLLDINLCDYFDLSRAGAYRLTARFHVPGQPEVKTRQDIFSISGTTK
jgi:hypothetical protein